MIELDLHTPSLLFLGDATDPDEARTAFGLARWRPEACVGQLRYANCRVDTGLPDMDIGQARRAGARSLIIGATPAQGTMNAGWEATLVGALNAGMDVVSGLHQPLEAAPRVANAAYRNGVRLLDLRRVPDSLGPARAEARDGRRLLTVGTDRTTGTLSTALALHRALRQAGVNATFRATGPTGMLIAGEGLVLDAVPADALVSAAEGLTPANDPDHWDIVEGRGALLHPACAPVALGLLHGVRPEALVLCHGAGRDRLAGYSHLRVPELGECLLRHVAAARDVCPEARFLGVALDTTGLHGEARRGALAAVAEHTGLPCVDPLVDGPDELLGALLATPGSGLGLA